LKTHHYKLLVIDIDGTLITRSGDISPQNRAALALARNSGMQVSLSTGRSLKSSLRIIDQLSLDNYHIFFDGALVRSPEAGEEIYAQPIDKAVVRQMIEFAHSHDIDLELYSATCYFAERETWSTEARRQFFGIEPTMGDFAKLWEQERIIKGGLTVTTPQEEAKAESLGHHFADGLHFSQVKTPTFPDVTFINILAPDVSKGKALEALASHLGVSLAEVMAVGDGKNDISLLSKAGLAIAMGNAHDELKKVADHITLDVEEHGLAAAIKRFLV
jgi:Cof subfamily protein (haloacid dehalogenase superfamily)